jgi:hypothetical protein
MKKVLIFLIFRIWLCDAVCDENTLITELRQDIIDNGKLDCTRSARIPSPEIEESGEQRKNRLAAVWDTDCAFSANYDWYSKLKTVYGMNKGYLAIK